MKERRELPAAADEKIRAKTGSSFCLLLPSSSDPCLLLSGSAFCLTVACFFFFAFFPNVHSCGSFQSPERNLPVQPSRDDDEAWDSVLRILGLEDTKTHTHIIIERSFDADSSLFLMTGVDTHTLSLSFSFSSSPLLSFFNFP